MLSLLMTPEIAHLPECRPAHSAYMPPLPYMHSPDVPPHIALLHVRMAAALPRTHPHRPVHRVSLHVSPQVARLGRPMPAPASSRQLQPALEPAPRVLPLVRGPIQDDIALPPRRGDSETDPAQRSPLAASFRGPRLLHGLSRFSRVAGGDMAGERTGAGCDVGAAGGSARAQGPWHGSPGWVVGCGCDPCGGCCVHAVSEGEHRVVRICTG